MNRESVIKAVRFLKTDIWRIRSRDLPRPKFLIIHSLRVIVLTVRGITEDRTMLRGSALTFFSLLSIVPVVAMIFGVAKGFGFEKTVERALYENFEGQEAVISKVFEFARTLLENVKGGLVAGIGLLLLFYSIIKILSHIENAFNDIWGVKKGRSLGRKVTDYLSLMLISPLLFTLSSAVTVFISGSARFIVQKISLLSAVGPMIFYLLKALPYFTVWVLFTFLYMFIPNTRVHFKSGLLGGFVAGTMYVLFQNVYITFQVGVSRYNAIYGSFAALPLFFIWLQISWLIVLFGAEMTFAHQNVDTYEFEQDCLSVSHSFKKLLSLRIVNLLVHKFSEGSEPWSASQISQALDIPIRLVRQILYELTRSRIVSEVRVENDREMAYQPAKDPEGLTLYSVIAALEKAGTDNIPVLQSEELDKISKSLETFERLVEQSNANKPLKEI
ncbi:MAG: YihY family inner membrane protein [Deltaproteobacteria bacterium]|nr:YihY family inner membrane protein [Deltaproteobacteria bacterium]MBW2016029.1 YihY family inner membrane protein [Deltaproteobacteria bacterium]MBW2128326.1 YihY family inner membrane protein [Deltaproteobacteria bacterium]MBW2302160.1 YihY family inner membrane protein [Deltaproteobacteria bacterium]